MGLTSTQGCSIAARVRTRCPSTEGATRDAGSDPDPDRSQARHTKKPFRKGIGLVDPKLRQIPSTCQQEVQREDPQHQRRCKNTSHRDARRGTLTAVCDGAARSPRCGASKRAAARQEGHADPERKGSQLQRQRSAPHPGSGIQAHWGPGRLWTGYRSSRREWPDIGTSNL